MGEHGRGTRHIGTVRLLASPWDNELDGCEEGGGIEDWSFLGIVTIVLVWRSMYS